jgi:hypothetical protein
VGSCGRFDWKECRHCRPDAGRPDAPPLPQGEPIRRILVDGERDSWHLSQGLSHIHAAAIRKILDFVDIADGVVSPSWPVWQRLEEPSEKAERLIRELETEFKRVAQLAVASVAKSTGPRFCPGGVAAERAFAEANFLQRLERRGWDLV